MEYERELKRAKEALARSKTKLPLTLKMKMTELIFRLTQERKNFGMFVILGWKNKWQRYADTPDSSQDIFARRNVNIMKIKTSPGKKADIAKTINFDGAI